MQGQVQEEEKIIRDDMFQDVTGYQFSESRVGYTQMNLAHYQRSRMVA